ncbi:MAG: rRNA maturation RNase YbeY [Candidatus Roizmanbacteria bacterium]|nr:rRNA maturation RNase YbeY [Candidatus Roizmanbacteria bacterium]
MINIVTSSRYKINRQKIKVFVQNIFEKEQINSDHSLNVVFVGKNKMKSLTERYKGEKETLPVLSFPYNEKVGEEDVLLGEVIICFPLVILLASERNKRVDEMINELIKHGVENLLK